MSTLKVFAILIFATLISFVLTAVYTESIIAAFIAAFVSQVTAASIIFKVDFGTWNPFK